jgi:hypothetical protein
MMKHRARRPDHVDEAGQDQADHAHEQELAHRRQVALGGVAVEAQRAEGSGRDEESARDRSAGVGEQ